MNRSAIALIIGIAVGILITAAFNRFRQNGRYEIHTMANSRIEALRLDRKTGDVWEMDYRGTWTRSSFPTSSDMKITAGTNTAGLPRSFQPDSKTNSAAAFLDSN